MGTTTSPCKWLQSDYLISYGSILSIGKATENDPTPEIGSDRISLSPNLYFPPLLGPRINVSINASNSICPSAVV